MDTQTEKGQSRGVLLRQVGTRGEARYIGEEKNALSLSGQGAGWPFPTIHSVM